MRRGAALVAVIGVLVAGCTGGGPSDERSSGAPEAPTTTVEPLPEEALLDHFRTSAEDDETELVRRAQEGVARCMHDKGFEYIPVIPADASSGTASPPVDEEYYATRGFGISIEPPPEDLAPTDEFVDPNEEYVASLSEPGRRAYEEALLGRPGDESNRGSHDPDDLGCMLVGSEQAADPTSARPVPPLVAELEEKSTVTYYERLETDPRMADAALALEDCAVAAGATDFDPTPDGVQVGYGEHTFSLFAGWGAYDQVWEAWVELTAGGAPDEDELARFQTWERDMAVAEYRCNAPVQAVMRQINEEVLREVVGPHRAELEDLAAEWSAE